MDMEGFGPENLIGEPPLIPWPKFADWIGMGDEPRVVESWVQRGYLPTQKVGKRIIMSDGNIATLQRILVHSSLTMTRRYAHLSPDHLVDAIRLGSLSSAIFH